MLNRLPRKLAALLCSLAFIAMSVFEIIHDLVRRVPWPSFTTAADNVVFILVPLWLFGAYSYWSRRGDLPWTGAFVGVLTTLCHGVVLRAGGASAGYLFIAAAVVLFFLSWYATPFRQEAIEEETSRAYRRAA